MEWAKQHQLGLDFNPSCFSHPLSADGFTLSHANPEIRQFWIEHCQASRRVSAYFGETARYAFGDEHLDPGRYERYAESIAWHRASVY
ncbi:L-rhamnose isomerase [Serratia fonticola]|uniref:L-rhamnose isomerase n=1 Tax=Serratia fonticola TaxID=47917 RepID=A0A4U9TJP1_SERFO|nr:L-rhamnose isomerase [Serratia fonticola]